MCSEQVTPVAIRLRGLGKCYHVYRRPLDRLWQAIAPGARYREFWALRGLDMDIAAGETVGIIGRNGSGKSTLLQMIAGTLTPTEGEVQVRGRIAALLELGSGFDPDFTGRENIYLNAAVLGLRRHEIDERFARIEAFADLGDYLDQPVRGYSSGMAVRLAFAVAINVDPDVLIIDEALAVGDEAFQRKCFARIDQMKRDGTTILFVSHAAASIVQLCDRAVLIDAGERVLTGLPKDVVARYQRLVHALPERRAQVRAELVAEDRDWREHGPPAAAPIAAANDPESPVVHAVAGAAHERHDPGFVPRSLVEYPSHGARILDPHLRNAAGDRVNVLIPGRDYVYTYEVAFSEAATGVHFGMMIKSMSGVELFSMASHAHGDAIAEVPAGAHVRVEFRFDARFMPGTYFLNAGCQARRDGQDMYLHRLLDAACFRIEVPASDRRLGGFFDLSREPAATWQTLPSVVRLDDAENAS
ncbi:ABC transporter ATP-binding protein [Arenimonas oryziterrae]|uniref:ABC transporter domain-containing protein n=1 Tax=Arenimonas oryziterrae DSM 21050 = YC6267 TaxID=1121015 RepID=A0A091BDY5_9GAMM|nr:ABC transporter ATP-binding protein [Arenimonas oryziterrae]KFN42620.1 hypothetical protein N789_13345 [Arenimonas oryziterrae DSM 21050 = YC6267]